MPGMILNAPAPQSLLGNEAPPDPGIINRLQLALAPMNPQAAQVVFGQQALQQQLQSLSRMPEFQGPGGLAKAYSIVSNPDLQKAYFGNPQEVGKEKAGDAERSIYGQGGHFINGPSSGGGLAELQKMSLEGAKAKELAIEEAKTQAGAEAALPNVQGNVDTALRLIEEVKNDPNLKLVVGPVAGRNPFPLSQGTVDKIEQIKNLAAMQGLQGLRGFGRIFQLEFAKSSGAAQRINRVATMPYFMNALEDAKRSLEGFRDRGLTAAFGGKPNAATPTTPATPGVIDYTHYFGTK